MDGAADPILKAQLVFFEGEKVRPYTDTRGKVTIGIGWNLTDNGLPLDLIDELYNRAVLSADQALDRLWPWWRKLDPVRQRAMENLMFNMGPSVLAQFMTFSAAMFHGKWDAAAAALQNSHWYSQTGRRGPLVVEMVKTGVDPKLEE